MFKLRHIRIAAYSIETDEKLYVSDGGFSVFGEFDIPDFYRNYIGLDEIEAMFLSHYHNHHIAGTDVIIKGKRVLINIRKIN